MNDDLIQEMRAGNLDLRKVGEFVLKLPLIAMQLGHKSLEKTDVYLHPESEEAQFAADVVFALRRGANRGLSTDAFLDKWFAGEAGALQLLGAMMATSHDGSHEGPDAA